ncbi:MAG: glycosyltransferase family 4 protein [Acidobacteria bacterium]|nr:glycosyltransferase family 4 protein [Acidobacteriota bacterium]
MTTERGWGGGERQLLLLMRELGKHGIEQTLAAPAGSPVFTRGAQAGHQTVALHSKAPMHPANLARLIRIGQWPARTIVHAHSSPALSLVSFARRFRRFAAVVFTRRTAYPVRRSRKYRVAADLYVAVSSAVEGRLIAAGTPNERLLCIPDAVDIENLGNDGSPDLQASLSGSRPLVLSVGRLSREKGHGVLIRAWPLVLEQVPRARLVIAGSGPEWSALNDLIGGLGLAPSVKLLGLVEPVGRLLQGADVFVMPSLDEGLGSAALEAMWMGLPVVASRTGGLAETVIEGRTGALVPPNDVAALGATIVNLLANPAVLAEMGDAARIHARSQFAASTMAASHLRAYRQALSFAARRRWALQ